MRREGEEWKPKEKNISRYRELSHRLKCFREMSWDRDLKSAIKYDSGRTLKNLFPNSQLITGTNSLGLWNTSFDELGVNLYKASFQTHNLAT